MSVIDKELWANLCIFCYSAPNSSTSLVSNYRTALLPAPRKGGRLAGRPRLPATCSTGRQGKGWAASGHSSYCQANVPLPHPAPCPLQPPSCVLAAGSEQSPPLKIQLPCGHLLLGHCRTLDTQGHWAQMVLGLMGFHRPLPAARLARGRVGGGNQDSARWFPRCWVWAPLGAPWASSRPYAQAEAGPKAVGPIPHCSLRGPRRQDACTARPRIILRAVV